MCMLVLAHLLAANLISASCSSIAPAPTPMPLPSVGYLPNTTRTQRTINTSGDQYPRKKGKSRPIRSTNPSSFYYSALLALSLSDSERSFSRIYSSFHQSRKKPPISAVGAGAGGESRTIEICPLSLSLPQTLLSKVASLGRQRLRQRRRPLLAKALFLSYQTAAEADSVSPRDRADKRRGAKHSTPKCLSSLHELSSISVEEC